MSCCEKKAGPVCHNFLKQVAFRSRAIVYMNPHSLWFWRSKGTNEKFCAFMKEAFEFKIVITWNQFRIICPISCVLSRNDWGVNIKRRTLKFKCNPMSRALAMVCHHSGGGHSHSRIVTSCLGHLCEHKLNKLFVGHFNTIGFSLPILNSFVFSCCQFHS